MAEVTAAGATQPALHAAAAAAGPGGRVCVAAADPGARLRMAVAGLVGVRDVAGGGLVGDVPQHAVGAASALSAGPGKAGYAGPPAEDELVDEDELLERDGVEGGGAAGCGDGEGGARKPCKDCSCGLAEAVAAGQAAAPEKQAPGKGCGSCALGDAFRCAACPYLGLPPFREGDKVEISAGLMTSDI
jgi:anamorsin